MKVDTYEDYNVNPIKPTIKLKHKYLHYTRKKNKIKMWVRQQGKENKLFNILQDL